MIWCAVGILSVMFFSFPADALARGGNGKPKSQKWELVWMDDFERDGFLDTTKWSKIPRGLADWNNYMSSRDDLYQVKDGCLILHGVENDN
ncbi:MAG: hypothetical protein K2N86_06735, partial [Rikenellaceae bacterium]|nr:hypothetical protein [Rikenellaceae bacterium]